VTLDPKGYSIEPKFWGIFVLEHQEPWASEANDEIGIKEPVDTKCLVCELIASSKMALLFNHQS